MASESLFSLLRDGREGVQFERTFRLLLILFHAWCNYSGERKACEGEASSGYLRAIYFDKFVMLVFRLWDAYFGDTGRKLMMDPDSVTAAEFDSAVTFPCPLREVPGKHGRGRALYDGKEEPKYVTEVLFDLQQEDILHYFEVSPPLEDPKNPKNFKTTVKPGLPTLDRQMLLVGFTGREVAVIEQLELLVRRLGPSHIRALGAHENESKTLADIDKEFRDPERQGLWDALEKDLEGGQDISSHLRHLHEYAEEAFRKSVIHAQDYAEARGFIESEITDEQLKRVCLECQKSKGDVWQSDDVQKLAEQAKWFYALTSFLTHLTYFQQHVRERDVQESCADDRREEWRRARDVLVSAGASGLPREIKGYFQGESHQLAEDIRRRLVDIVRKTRQDVRA